MSNVTDFNQVLTTYDVSELLLCDIEDVIDLAEKGDLPGIVFGDEWVFPQSALYKVLHVEALKQMEKRKGNRNG